MNTPSHYILNLVILCKTIAPNNNEAIAIGAILPDLPIFIFYGVAKLIYRLPEKQIWTETYYTPVVQFWVALGHSFPIAIVGLAISSYYRWSFGVALFASIICHSLLDIPVHNDDAHRHFFPVSDYRFISPLSYWDVNHYGRIVAFVEILLVIIVTPFAFDLLKNSLTKGIVIAIDLIYIVRALKF
jgi:hypothetical protein